jgi:subtilisin family serine protease
MDLRNLLLIQAIIISFFLVTLYVLLLKIEAIEEGKLIESLEDNKFNFDENKKENNIGVIKNQYIVVLRDNATFIDEFTRTNWIKRAVDENNGSYSKIIHYYSFPKDVGWNTPSESMRILKKKNYENIESFKGFAAKLSPDMYEYFVRHPSVRLVESDEYVKLDDIVENEGTDDKISLKIKESFEDNNNNNANDHNGISGSSYVYKIKSSLNLSRLINRKPVTSTNNAYYKFSYESAYDVFVYFIDTGVNVDHTDFIDKLGYDTVNKNRVIIGKNFVTDETTSDLNGHGTHVAGIIGSTTWGVAKRVNIVSVKVMNKNGSGKWSDIIASIEWSRNHLFSQTTSKKGVLNISLSGSVKESANSAIRAAISQGIHVSVAAGNNGKEACAFSPASASAYGAVVVGSIGNDDSYSKFSNYGKCVSIFAPGYKITSTSNVSNTGSKEMSGTSMAAPHVAGVMALILSAKDMSPKELYNTLISEASSDYIKNLDSNSPNKIVYIPNYAIVSRCNPLDPNDCISTLNTDYTENIDDEDYFSKIKTHKTILNSDYIVLQQ